MGINEMIDAVAVCVKCGQKPAPRGKCDCWIWREDLKRFVENPDSAWNKKQKKKPKSRRS